MNLDKDIWIISIILFSIIVCQPFDGDIVSSTATSQSNSLNDIGDATATAISSSSANNQHSIQIIDPSITSISLVPDSIDIENIQSATTFTDCQPVNWISTEKQANDIAVSPQGDVFSVGINGKLYQYNFLSNTWTLISSKEQELNSVNRISVSYDGTPYIITSSGETYYNNCDKDWVKLPGCATEIAVGRGGEVFKLGCDLGGNGFSLFKLFCDSENEGNENMNTQRTKCNRFRKWWECISCSKKLDNRKCYWFKLTGSGIKMSVNTKGNPVVIDVNGNILVYDEEDWYTVSKGMNARDIDVSNDGEIFFTNNFNELYKIGRGNWTPVKICGKAKGVTIGPFGQPFVIGPDFIVYTSSKQCFN